MAADNSIAIHPLIGVAIPSPVASKIYQSTLKLEDWNCIRDHQIGRHKIFSEAWYLEMCLAAGLTTIAESRHSGHTKALKIQNLKIVAPFSLIESKIHHLQTIAKINVNKGVVDWSNLQMEIFQSQPVQESEPITWFSLASGTFTSVLTTDETSPTFDTTLFQEALKTSVNMEFLPQMYETMAKVGLKLGPYFQVFDDIWWNGTDGKILLRVDIKSDMQLGPSEYVMNPLLLDAMVQAIMMINLATNEKKRLAILNNVGKFIWLHQQNLKSTELFISASIDYYDNKKFSGSALLVDSAGIVFAVISSVEFMYTTVKNITSILENQSSPMPPLWDEVWLPKLLPEPVAEEKAKEAKFWLWFCDEKISSYLMEKIAATSKRLVVVKDGNKFELLLEKGLASIRQEKEDDFCELLKCLFSKKIDLEGIFYGWAINSHGNVKQDEVLRPYMYLTKSLLNSGFKCSPRLLTVTQGAIAFGAVNTADFSVSTIWGFTKALKTENIEINVKIVELESDILSKNQLDDVYRELLSDDKEIMVAYRNGTRFCPKLRRHFPPENFLEVPHGTNRFKLAFPEQRSTSDIKFVRENVSPVQENEVEVQTKAFSLNNTMENKNTSITNFSGVVNRVGKSVTKWKVGDRVFGCNTSLRMISSHVIVEQDFLFLLSPQESFCEGATMCVDYMVAIICLIKTAEIKSDDVVLIHNASGGVGLSVIKICREVGCTIIATASSMRQQNYLRLQGIHYVFSTKDSEFATKILELTNKKGVDVLLNFLIDNQLKEECLQICAKGARLVEMSKVNRWKSEQIQQLRSDVKYFHIGLDNVFAKSQAEKKPLFDTLRELINRNVVKPSPYTRYDAINLKTALKCLEVGEHVGNIVCVMPEWKLENGNVKVHTPLFNECGTYLITGGLGGIGFTVCKWMLEEGAKYIVLAGRSPPNSQMGEEIMKLNSMGKHVVTVQLDVGNLEQCRQLVLTEIIKMGLPPLKGVMHTAFSVEHGPITKQNWNRRGAIWNSKIYGSLNLHEVTKSLNLEHFVVYSSVASLIGLPSCCNYVSGNCFLDAFAHFRHSIGLPATTINWGQWGEVGAASDTDLPGFKVLSNVQALNGLEYVLKTNQLQLSVGGFDSLPLLDCLLPIARSYVDKKEWDSCDGVENSKELESVMYKFYEFLKEM